MSGIVGIVNLDGAPVDRDLAHRLTDSITFRGPDARSVWIDGSVGLGHTLLRTTAEAAFEQQPLSLDDQVWITADARLDGRRELVAQLQARGAPRIDLNRTPDVALILHAYNIWGEECAHHLVGDFAFAIWDSRRRRLFCARDPLGLKLFYYARVGPSFIFSNTLDCLRRHPLVSTHLNERALGDFLLFRVNFDLRTTAFADIRRLPGGSALSIQGGDMRERAYWTFPVGKPIRYKQASDYVDHFTEILTQAVGDRLRADHITLLMSGGMDSTSIAAAAVDVAARSAHPIDIQARTGIFRRALADDEQTYAQLVADALNLPIRFIALDELDLGSSWLSAVQQVPEPALLIVPPSIFYRHLDAGESRVLLWGHGADLGLKMSMLTVAQMLGAMPVWDVAADVMMALRVLHRRPAFGLGIRDRLFPLSFPPAKPFAGEPYPSWLNEDFARRIDLRERWSEIRQAFPLAPIIGGRHQDARRTRDVYQSGLEVATHEWWDAGMTRLDLEVRFPFLDLRLIKYLLAIPALPWAEDKTLLRLAMSKRLPERVVRRPKTGLAANPVFALLSEDRMPRASLLSIDELYPYVDVESFVREPTTRQGGWFLPPTSHLLSIGLWLRRVRQG